MKNNLRRTLRDDVAVSLVHISKKYEIHHEKPTLVEKFVIGRNETFWALKDINVTIKKGEKVGIMGPNGSGKTTLLKIIAGITTPTSGIVKTNGKIVSLIDLEAGFHLDLTGEQNIYLNAMLFGMNKRIVEHTIDRIIAFAGVGKFIDAPLFTYSEGMKLRLGFSVAVHANPDIFLLDEGISVGDADFQEKTSKKIKDIYRSGKSIIIVSHWLEYIQKNCDRIITLQRGKIVQS
jgi:ABC-type polysaccharide/polyol phosphate transport system ATPase subunit